MAADNEQSGSKAQSADSSYPSPDTRQQSPRDEEEFSFLNFAIILAKHKRLVIGLPLVATLVAAAISLLMPNWYTATTKLLPPQQSQSNAVAILGQLGALTGGASAALGVKNPSDIFVAMLKSRTVADSIIGRFKLKEVYDKEYLQDTRKALSRNVDIIAARDGVITLEVEDKSPQRAADMANAYVEELENLTLKLAVGEAGQRRLFFEKQLQKAKQDLANAEIELQRLQEKTGIINPSGQAGLSVAAAAGLRAQITAKEVQLGTLRSFATDQNPDLLRSEKELESLRAQLAKMGKTSDEKGDVLVGIGRVPGASIEFIKKYRDVKYYETLFELLAKQFEIAKIDEAKDATLIQVLDRADQPERKSKPRRTLIVLSVAVMSSVVGVLLALGLEGISQARKNPRNSRRLELMHSYVTGKSGARP